MKVTTSVIHKFTLDRPVSDLPHGMIRAVAMQNSRPTVWVELDPSGPRNTVEVFATGEYFDATHLEHVGTAVSDALVWHVYRRKT